LLTLRAQKSAQRWLFSPLHSPYQPEPFQGVTLDSLGVDTIEIERMSAPDRRQHRKEAPKHSLAMPGWFGCFWAVFLHQRGR
jgi:hypothetical protein